MLQCGSTKNCFIKYQTRFLFKGRFRWYKLRGKPSKEKKEVKERGDLEVKVAFIVKSGSLADLSKKEKHKSSLGQLSTALGSILSLGISSHSEPIFDLNLKVTRDFTLECYS